MNQVIRIKQWGVRQQGSGFNNHLKVQGWEERRHGGFGESWLGEKRGNRNYNLDGARAKQPHLAVDMEDHQATYCPGRVRPACSSSACSRGTGSPCLHADLRLRKTAVPLPLQLRAILAAGKMAEEQASGAASLAGDDDWDAGELTRTMAAHGQRPAAGRHAPRLSVPTRAAAAVLLGLHLHLDLHAMRPVEEGRRRQRPRRWWSEVQWAGSEAQRED